MLAPFREGLLSSAICRLASTSAKVITSIFLDVRNFSRVAMHFVTSDGQRHTVSGNVGDKLLDVARKAGVAIPGCSFSNDF